MAGSLRWVVGAAVLGSVVALPSELAPRPERAANAGELAPGLVSSRVGVLYTVDPSANTVQIFLPPHSPSETGEARALHRRLRAAWAAERSAAEPERAR